jgi:CRP-like cAMP-binding protein/membrane protease YdiL (CAAX protease family)
MTSASDRALATPEGFLLPEIEARMSKDTLDALKMASREIDVTAGDTIISEGDLSETMYLVRVGNFGIYRAQKNDENPFHIADIGPGQMVGEMALLDGFPRSATVRATTDGHLLEITPSAVRALPEGEFHLNALRGALASALSTRLRRTNDEHVGALEREIQLKEDQKQFGSFFIYALVMMSIGTLVNNIIARNSVDVDVYTAMFAWQYLAVLLIPSVFVIWRMRIPLQSLGLTMVGLKRSLIEGIVISVIMVALATAIAAVLRANDALPGQVVPFEVAGGSAYLLHSALQELLARGFLQSAFQRFLGKVNGLGAVLLSSVFFGMFHLHFGLIAVGMTIATGAIFGLLYMRHQNLAGVTLVHFMAGVAAFSNGLL